MDSWIFSNFKVKQTLVFNLLTRDRVLKMSQFNLMFKQKHDSLYLDELCTVRCVSIHPLELSFSFSPPPLHVLYCHNLELKWL